MHSVVTNEVVFPSDEWNDVDWSYHLIVLYTYGSTRIVIINTYILENKLSTWQELG